MVILKKLNNHGHMIFHQLKISIHLAMLFYYYNNVYMPRYKNHQFVELKTETFMGDYSVLCWTAIPTSLHQFSSDVLRSRSLLSDPSQIPLGSDWVGVCESWSSHLKCSRSERSATMHTSFFFKRKQKLSIQVNDKLKVALILQVKLGRVSPVLQ